MASKGVNKVILVGRLSQDVEIRYMPNGGAVANINVVTSESWRDKGTGEEKEKAEFHRVAIFGKLAEVAGEYLRKGSQVYIEGQLQTRKWQDQSGQDRYTTEVVVQGFNGVMQMLGGKQGGGANTPSRQPGNDNHQGHGNAPMQQRGGNQGSQGGMPPPQQAPQQVAPQYNEPPQDFDDDIPF